MSDYDTPYDLAADQYANDDLSLYVGEVTDPAGTVHDVEAHPTKPYTVIVTGPDGRGREVDASATAHYPNESTGDAYLRIATEHVTQLA